MQLQDGDHWSLYMHVIKKSFTFKQSFFYWIACIKLHLPYFRCLQGLICTIFCMQYTALERAYWTWRCWRCWQRVNHWPGCKIIKSMPVPKYIFGPGPKMGFRARNVTQLAPKHIFGPGGVIIWPQKTFSGQPPINWPENNFSGQPGTKMTFWASLAWKCLFGPGPKISFGTYSADIGDWHTFSNPA